MWPGKLRRTLSGCRAQSGSEFDRWQGNEYANQKKTKHAVQTKQFLFGGNVCVVRVW